MATEQKNAGTGFWGRILHVNLTEGSFEYEDLEREFYANYLSGVGLGAKVLWDRLKPGVDPLGPENILGFTTGILTDTPSLFTGRFTVVGKSPLSGGWGDSNCGGYFAPFLKRCQVDAVFFYGASEKPVYLYMDGKEVRIEDAGEIWGKDIVETEDYLKEKYGKRVQVASIGQSGENLCRFAGICNDGGRIAARSGLGAVMGSKNLKAVVAAGKKRVGAVEKETMKNLTKEFRERFGNLRFLEKVLDDKGLALTGWITRVLPVYPRQPSFLWRTILRKYGTPGLTSMSAESGDSPIKNWGGAGCSDFPLSTVKAIGPDAVIQFQQKKYGCFSCPLQCGGIMKVDKGPHQLAETHKPEYETICAFGGMALNNDVYSIYKLNDMCNRAGIDTISCGAVCAFAVECFENGILTEKDTGGIKLAWGDGEALIRLTELIINREGIGDILAEGVKVASAQIQKGSDQYAVHCGGVEPPMHDPRVDVGYGMAYYCDPTPGRHTVCSNMYLDLQELEKQFPSAEKPAQFFTDKEKYRTDNKAKGIAIDTYFKMLVDCSGLCMFGTQTGGEMPLVKWLNAATGFDFTPDEYLAIGERVHQLRHAFNVREGINEAKNPPHGRTWGSPPLEKGPYKGLTLDMEALGKNYYSEMGWNWETGKPLPARMKGLGLETVTEALK
ncbi:MAG: aldehyde ferredoxin oxidoreductase family protein [Desulfatibacillum sp.]|nr:aldehyde ferredoxin oxidoreductase family protein [Desulfatibacillum sp.]